MAPELDSDGIFILFFESVMKSDLLADSPALNQPVDKFDTIDNKFDAITYAKGWHSFSYILLDRAVMKSLSIVITNSSLLSSHEQVERSFVWSKALSEKRLFGRQ